MTQQSEKTPTTDPSKLNIEKDKMPITISAEIYRHAERPIILVDQKLLSGSIKIMYVEKDDLECTYQHDVLGTTKIKVPFFILQKNIEHRLVMEWDTEKKFVDIRVDEFEIHIHQKMTTSGQSESERKKAHAGEGTDAGPDAGEVADESKS